MEHVALSGRLDHEDTSWWVKLILTIGAWKNDDPTSYCSIKIAVLIEQRTSARFG